MFVNSNNITYFDSFGVGHIPKKKKKKFIGNKNIITNIYQMQAYNSRMCGLFGIGFIYFILKCKSLLDYTNSFSPKEYEKSNKITLKYFQ